MGWRRMGGVEYHGKKNFCRKKSRPLTVSKSTCAKMDSPKFGPVASYKRVGEDCTLLRPVSTFIISCSFSIYHTQQINTLDGPKDHRVGGSDVLHLSARLDPSNKQCSRIRDPANRELCVLSFGAAIDSCGSKPVTHGGSVTLYVLSLLLPVPI